MASYAHRRTLSRERTIASSPVAQVGVPVGAASSGSTFEFQQCRSSSAKCEMCHFTRLVRAWFVLRRIIILSHTCAVVRAWFAALGGWCDNPLDAWVPPCRAHVGRVGRVGRVPRARSEGVAAKLAWLPGLAGGMSSALPAIAATQGR